MIRQPHYPIYLYVDGIRIDRSEILNKYYWHLLEVAKTKKWEKEKEEYDKKIEKLHKKLNIKT